MKKRGMALKVRDTQSWLQVHNQWETHKEQGCMGADVDTGEDRHARDYMQNILPTCIDGSRPGL